MSCIWGGTPTMMVYSFVKQWQSWSLEWSKDWLNRLKTKKKTESHSTKSPSSNWVSWRPLSLSCSWTTHYCYLQRSREVVEVAAGRVGYWHQITGCIHRNLRAKQSVPSSSIYICPATWSYSAPFMISMSQHWGLLAQSCLPESNVIKDPPASTHFCVKFQNNNKKQEDVCREIPQACLCSLTKNWGSVHLTFGAFSTFTVSHVCF